MLGKMDAREMAGEDSKGTILIAGGRGFIGGHLTRFFIRDSYRVISIDSGLFAPSKAFLETASANFLVDCQADASGHASLFRAIEREETIDIIANCAGPARPSFYLAEPVLTAESICNCTRNLLRLAREKGASYVHASSSEVYGDLNEPMTSETGQCNLHTLSRRAAYAEAKRFAETLVSAYARRFGVKVAILRLFNVYGPLFGEDDDRVIATFIKALDAEVPLPIYGDGSQVRSFCHIDDVVAAFDIVRQKINLAPICVNIGNPEPTTILKLAEIMAKIANKPLEVSWKQPRGDEVKRRVPDIRRANELLGWEPTIGLPDGLRECISIYSKKKYEVNGL